MAFLSKTRVESMYGSGAYRSGVTRTVAFVSAIPLKSNRFHTIKVSHRQKPRLAMSSATTKVGVSRLQFESTFTEKLPPDTQRDNGTRQVLNAAYSRVKPTSPAVDDVAEVWRGALAQGQVRSGERGEPELEKALIAWSPACAELFDLDCDYPDEHESKAIIEVLGGFGELWPGMNPYAMCYGGHQFGSWAGQLGDGRAISLGEYVNKKGERWEIQLKGAGKTPYSRFADGRAVLRSSVREFLCSEAMYYLGVPTTRALSLVGTGAGVIRDMFYSGSPQMEPGAVVSRVAPSFLRLGNFQLAAFRQDRELLKATADYAIDYHFPEFKDLPEDKENEGGKYTAFVNEVAKRNAKMVAKWQGIGFVHGVMNTDNFSILGLTLDYGPYGFLDAYDPNYTPNTTDIPGRRYKFEAQPTIAHWNILMFAKAMVSLCGNDRMQNVVKNYESIYDEEYYSVMSAKLGLSSITTDEDKELLEEFLRNMEEAKADHTNTWRALAKVSASSSKSDLEGWCALLKLNRNDKCSDSWMSWLSKYQEKLKADQQKLAPEDRVSCMNKTNPVYILRNYIAQTAIEQAEKGDYTEVRRLYSLLTKPYDEQDGMKMYTEKPPSWASKPGVSVNSCSS